MLVCTLKLKVYLPSLWVIVLLQSKNWSYVAEWLSKLTLSIASDVRNCTIFFPPFLPADSKLYLQCGSLLVMVQFSRVSPNLIIRWCSQNQYQTFVKKTKNKVFKILCLQPPNIAGTYLKLKIYLSSFVMNDGIASK